MAKLPSAADLGVTPSVQGSAPVGNFDGAAGAMSRVGAAQRQTAQAVGKGVGELGSAVADVGLEKSRYEYATAHAQALSQVTDLHARMANDPDYATMSDRYDKAATEIYNNAAERISLPSLRTRFVELAAPAIAKTKAAAGGQAQKLEADANVAYITEQGDKFITQGVENPHDATLHKQQVDAYGAVLDDAHGRGFISAEGVLKAKQEWARQYAIADGLERGKTDPLGVINTLRAAPGSIDQVDLRIAQIESNGNPLAKSKTSRAMGLGQFEPDTWLPLIKKYHPELADRGDDELLSLRADRHLSMEMIGKNREENTNVLKAAGVDGSAGNLYLAHFLGPASAAAVVKAGPNVPISDVLKGVVGEKKADAMIAANSEILRGQTAGSVAQWANDKMGGVGPGGGHIYDLLRPDQRAMLLQHAEQQLQARQVNDHSEFLQRRADTLSESDATGAVQKPMAMEEFVNAFGADRGPKEYREYKATLQLGEDKAQVASLSHDQQEELLKKYDPQPGEGFADAEKRRKVLASEIERVRKIRTNDPDFQSRYSDSLAEAASTGQASRPIPRDEFVNRFGSRDGPKSYAQYTAALRLGREAKHAGELSPAEQQALLGGYDPDLQKLMSGTDYDTALKRRHGIATAIDQVNQEKNDDPAGFAIRRLPAVGEAYTKFGQVMADPQAKPEDRSAAARDYAIKTEMEQARVGVPEDRRVLLPKEYVERFNKAITSAADSDDAQKRVGMIGQIQREADTWGKEHWPAVMRQLTPSAQPIVRAIAAQADPVAMTRLLSLPKDENPAKVLKEQNETKFKDVTTNLNDAMAPFRRSLVGRQLDRDYPGYYSLAEKLTALYVRDGDDASTAAGKAFNALIGNRYDFRDSWRMPKGTGVSADDVQAGVQVVRGALGNERLPTNLEAAKAELKLTPQEEGLYRRHLTNLTGPGGVDNPDGSRSTLFQMSVERDGKTYNLPTVWDGKILKPEEALKRAEREGFDKFPSYGSEAEAEARYDKMHAHMEQDTARYLEARRAEPLVGVRAAIDDMGVSDNRSDSLTKFARDGVFVTSPDNAGLNLTYGNKFVRGQDGKPLFLPWAELAKRGDSKDGRAAAATSGVYGFVP